MEQIPDIFRRGKVAYDKLVATLFEYYKLLPLTARKELFSDKSKKINDSKDATGYKNMIKEFNSLVQYSLLDAGTSNDKISYLEMLYVADIGDLETRLDHYLQSTTKKSDKKFKYTYLMLPDATPEEVLYIKTCIYEYLEPTRMHMMKAFQIINKISKDNKILDMLPDFAELFDAFLRVDGRMEKEDPMIAVSKMKETFYNHIDDYKNKVKSLMK